MLKQAIALALLAGAALGAHAQKDEVFRSQEDKFRSLDANRDGFLSKEETRAIKGGYGTKNYNYAFDEADDNRDGKLDASEFTKAESVYARQQSTAYLDDGALTAKVKTALLRERSIKSTDVHVESQLGVVYLSGWAQNEKQRAHIAKVASLVDGVREVRNGIAIR